MANALSDSSSRKSLIRRLRDTGAVENVTYRQAEETDYLHVVGANDRIPSSVLNIVADQNLSMKPIGPNELALIPEEPGYSIGLSLEAWGHMIRQYRKLNSMSLPELRELAEGLMETDFGDSDIEVDSINDGFELIEQNLRTFEMFVGKISDELEEKILEATEDRELDPAQEGHVTITKETNVESGVDEGRALRLIEGVIDTDYLDPETYGVGDKVYLKERKSPLTVMEVHDEFLRVEGVDGGKYDLVLDHDRDDDKPRFIGLDSNGLRRSPQIVEIDEERTDV